jgi:hypothetical protein
MRKSYKILTGKPEGKRSFGRPRLGQKNIRLDLRETGRERVNWIHLRKDRDQLWFCNIVLNLWVP